jgi:hypothetical protein
VYFLQNTNKHGIKNLINLIAKYQNINQQQEPATTKINARNMREGFACTHGNSSLKLGVKTPSFFTIALIVEPMQTIHKTNVPE